MLYRISRVPALRLFFYVSVYCANKLHRAIQLSQASPRRLSEATLLLPRASGFSGSFLTTGRHQACRITSR